METISPRILLPLQVIALYRYKAKLLWCISTPIQSLLVVDTPNSSVSMHTPPLLSQIHTSNIRYEIDGNESYIKSFQYQ